VTDHIEEHDEHPLDRIVDLIAPRSRGDFVLKLFLIQVLLAGLYICKEVLLGMELAEMTFPDVRPVFVLGFPFIWFSLSIMWHQRKLHEKLADLAVTDVLTSLANRRGFLQMVSDGDVFERDGILLLLDVDHFKRVNDSLGHGVGDQCLVAVARRLQSLARVEDCVARYGGEEFVMFLNGAAEVHLNSIRDRLTMTIPVRLKEVADVEVSVTLSAGAVALKAGDNVIEKMAQADNAMYQAKEAGRARLFLGGRLAA